MDAHVVWRDDFNIGVDVIDKEHQRLFKIINKLFNFKEEEKDNEWICQEGIKFFKGHILKHFTEEEAYMRSIGYEGLEQHRRVHKSFQENTLPALEQELERTNYADNSVEHFLGVCAGWLIGHTKTEDLAIVNKHPRKWDNLLPSEETLAMRKVIVQLIFDMFRLESQMISDAYNGEKFGRGVYYRLVFGKGNDNKVLEIIMVFEEKLLINTVGQVLGIKTNKLNGMLVNAARHTARQFVGRVMEQFPSMADYELKEENLLSYDRFQKLLEKENLQVSLLFNTGGAGYFAYCVISPHLLEQGVGEPLVEEYAMDEVEKYLMQRKTQENDGSKLKILLVDDSLTVRKSIKKLLDDDYDVSLVDSGLAAIRAITLNRPDLILLDYEMPVCDGQQTLAMLRSDQTFGDIPVIFLTGRSDPESVRKVMMLKPAGYLLKYLKPEEIKSKIDNFFSARNAQSFA